MPVMASKMNGQIEILSRMRTLRGFLTLLLLTIAFARHCRAMPTNPASLKQNIMTGDLVSDSGSIGSASNLMSPLGVSLQSVNQEPKLTPVRGTKEEQCSDKESLICKLEHDLKEAEQTLQCEINELQHALGQSNAAEKASERLADQSVNILNQALNCDKNALCRTQEMSAKACGGGNANGNGSNGKFQRVITVRQDALQGTPLTSSAPGQKEKIYVIQNNSRQQPSPGGKGQDYSQDYNMIDDGA